jgi:3'-phosphoadenosine 5'-phosphosulfate sulfotransferase (PAPS reductase)/FAD synthetase/3'-phosphoadenosine 5'-phosphosulfate sulfotransferase
MLKIITRSRSDASAVKHALAKFYGVGGYEVISLRGLRGSRLLEALCEELGRRDAYTVALLGREDIAGDVICPHMSPLATIVVMNKRKVRNARQHEIINAVNTGKSIIRSRVTWDPRHQVYRIGKCEGCYDLPYPKDEVSDPFLIYGDGVRKLSKVLGKGIRGSLLLVRRWAGEHMIFVKGEPTFRVRFSDDLNQPVTVLEERKAEVDSLEGVDLTKVVEGNKEVVEVMKEISVRYLRSLSENPDNVVVPVSGGKDSTASLALAVSAFGNKSVTAVYVDTGVDFISNKEVVEKLAKELGVRLVTVKAPVGTFLREGREPFPTHDNRWCTKLKQRALKEFLEGLPGTVTVVVGDREVESRGRSHAPYVRREGRFTYLYPIKHWSTISVQVFNQLIGLPENLLYWEGFYRTGCYVCPSLRSWEIYVLLNSAKGIKEYVDDVKLFERFRHGLRKP